MPEISHFTARAGSPQARRALSPMFSGTAEATKTQTATVLRSLSGEPNGVGDYVSGARTIRVAKNQDVVIAGNPYERFYANHDGWLFRYKILHKGGDRSWILCSPAISLRSSPACSRAPSIQLPPSPPAVLSVIMFDKIDEVFERNPKLSKLIFWSAACESARLAEHLTDAARRSAYERVSHLLLELFIRLKAVGLTEGMAFHMPLTQELIGDALGLTTIHVNRTLRLLRENHLIDIDGKRVTILNFEALSLLSDFEASYLGDSARALRATVSIR
jgi:hypothetical protein